MIPLTSRLLGVRGHAFTLKKRVVSCIILITLILIPLVFSLIVMESMMGGIMNKFIYLQDGHIQIYGPIEDIEPLTSMPGIYAADRVVQGYGLVYSGAHTAEVILKGVDDSYFNELRLNEIKLETSQAELNTNIFGAIISQTIAKELQVNMHDRFAMMIVSDEENQVVRPILVQVTGIYSSGYLELDRNLVFLNYDQAEKIFSHDSSVHILAEPSQDIDELISKIDTTLTGMHSYRTWESYNQTVYANFISSRQAIFTVLLVIILVAAVYLASIAQELVQDQRETIISLKLIGLTSSKIRVAFFKALFIVIAFGIVLGSGLGIILGLQLSSLLSALTKTGLAGFSYYLLDFSVIIPWLEIGLICLLLATISIISIFFSLRRISKVAPLELFRHG